MSGDTGSSPFFVGWDVGGWNCDKNSKSRDALVILDAAWKIVGKPWRGNLRTAINEADSSAEWIVRLFNLCKTNAPNDARLTLAIDTPLGFSGEFVRLVTHRCTANEIGRSNANPYLFRQTERFLFELGYTPLSAIKDMIGSQATKGMHALAKFAPQVVSCGVWSDGQRLIAIEAYPSACKRSAAIKALQQPFGKLAHDDLDDALTCALLAYLFNAQPEALIQPGPSVPASEGWIWVPGDGLPTDTETTKDAP